MSARLFDLSLVICTRNRADQLVQTLHKLSVIRSQLHWELVVVDNESTDQTSAVLESFAANFDHPVQIIKQQGRGVAIAKNAGWQAARADIVVCLDDDAVIMPHELETVPCWFTKMPRMSFLGG